MKTDKALYKIFAAYPQLLFDIANLQPDDTYKMISITLKEFERRADGFLQPESEESPVYFVELQAYDDETIYHRTIMEMAAYGVQNPKREIRGILVFTHQQLDNKTLPWHELTHSKKNVFKVIYLEEYLKKLQKKDANNPVVALFQPYLIKNKKELEKQAKKWYQNIKKCQLPAKVKESFEMVFTQWMLERFANLTYEEVTKMFAELTPIEETRSYRELVAIGEKKGEKRGEKRGEELATRRLVARLIAKRFNIHIQRVIPRLRTLPVKDVEALSDLLFSMRSFNEAFQWIDERKRQIKLK
jgi:predicted transposase/invertase (TIGR01784 family)